MLQIYALENKSKEKYISARKNKLKFKLKINSYIYYNF